MKILRILSVVLFCFMAIVIASCKDEKKKDKPSTSFDTGRLFIESCLKGDFNAAASVLDKDDQNNNYFELFKKQYDAFTPAEKQAYQKTDYIIEEIKEPNDTVCLIRYHNNYKNQPTNIRLIRKQQQWLVDFKYTFQSNDSLK